MDSELKQHLENMEARLRRHTDDVETRLREHVSFECEKVETRLLAEFWKWGRTAETKIRRIEFSDATTVERLSILEERIFALERKSAGSKE